MHASLRSRCVRALAAGALSAALVSAGSAGAFAVGNAPMPTPSATHSKTPMTKASITIKANQTSVKAGQSVTFTGQTTGLKSGTKLVLQHLRNGKWTTLSSSTTVTKGHTYALTGKLSTKGTQHLRVSTSGTTHSPTVIVKVS
ncbi:hypothetical protein AQI88_03420 [Streptomyces cellostaticus]|uniref:Bacterial Ig domain-containing protein n=1 Tax=Streptomyces cellostaticus TaxID=67285 RepID=A0A101NSJ9_9ACTN|nr:hypothetical protein [Streptomyces cellostaticus]KUM98434.1 hypothetical protein AQI88_03420 [Streptomyces cellostaticus]GHI02832.1 hypothetical protein Scel_11530 [Streptomyces cellostaticus]